MVWNKNYFDNNSEEENNGGLVYDLRQTLQQLIDEVLKRIANSRYEQDFTSLFNALGDLKIEINQKLSKEEREEYRVELKNCVKVLNQNSSIFNGLSKNQSGTFHIKEALRILEEWLRDRMEDHKLFGDQNLDREDGL